MPVERTLSNTELSFEKDLQEVEHLQETFDTSLKRKAIRKMLAYNPVLERWRFEQTLTETDEIRFRTHEEQQIKTTLRERLQTAKSVVTYKIDEEGNAFNEFFPNEPFDTVLKRGIAYRKSVGSTETERENSELDGWRNIFNNLLDPTTPNGFKYIVISAPGVAENTSYPHNFVDIYEKISTPSGETAIRMTRSAAKTAYKDYIKAASDLNPQYFAGFSGPIDAWFLANPIPVPFSLQELTPDEVFAGLFEDKTDSINNEMFEQILESCMPLILNYIDVLCQDTFDPKQVAIAFNAVLNKADLEKQLIAYGRKDKLYIQSRLFFRNIKDEASYLGTRPVQEVLAGCGHSEGFETDTTQNSVSQFAIQSADKGWHVGICVKCNSLTSVGGCNICAACVIRYYSNN